VSIAVVLKNITTLFTSFIPFTTIPKSVHHNYVDNDHWLIHKLNFRSWLYKNFEGIVCHYTERHIFYNLIFHSTGSGKDLTAKDVKPTFWILITFPCTIPDNDKMLKQ
jgi:hypothetical protein